ncbi:hypothetical protein QCA50_015060 [Cerrena zonata]|uniref:Uncharacterized protein n=1 Tax=Cerrena zonata TaxID=2478898 RepID=A0AAW0FJ23_9APHY
MAAIPFLSTDLTTTPSPSKNHLINMFLSPSNLPTESSTHRSNKVWITTSLHIVDIIKDRKINLVSVGTARFFTNPTEEGREGSLGPVVIWIGVKPGTTSPNTAHEASQEILAYLKSEGIKGVEVEWKESLLQKLAGPPLLQDP